MRYKTRTTQKRKKNRRKEKRGVNSWGGPADESKTRGKQFGARKNDCMWVHRCWYSTSDIMCVFICSNLFLKDKNEWAFLSSKTYSKPTEETIELHSIFDTRTSTGMMQCLELANRNMNSSKPVSPYFQTQYVKCKD